MKNTISRFVLWLLCGVAVILVGCDEQPPEVKNRIKAKPSVVIDTFSVSDEAERAASPFLERQPESKIKK